MTTMGNNAVAHFDDLASVSDHRRVAYFFDEDIVQFYYGRRHPMKPRRIGMTNELVMAYGLYKRLIVHRPHRSTPAEMMRFHSSEYIDMLTNVTPATFSMYKDSLQKYGLIGDCPPFDGVATFCSISAGGTLDCANLINRNCVDIAINWSGGLHHAKKQEASGFCYTNDIVLGILELLKRYQRVLYIDVDCHHGDGVEEAFYTTDRVLTVSFHQYGDIFPYTGNLTDVGAEKGTNFAVNVPFAPGVDDESYMSVFKPIINSVNARFRPDVVVLQCGADSLAGDRLGSLNLTTRGHGRCVEFVRRLNLPLILLGGGGYTIRNVARCWAYETGIAVGVDLVNEIPNNFYRDHFAPTYCLHTTPSPVKNYNSDAFLSRVRWTVQQQLKAIPIAPSVQMHQTAEPSLPPPEDKDDQEMIHSDHRLPEYLTDNMVEHPAEFYGAYGDHDKSNPDAGLHSIDGDGPSRTKRAKLNSK